MSTAAIAIDNFLDSSKWNTIQSGISSYLTASDYSENRTSLQTDINSWIKDKLTGLSLWQNSWDDDVKLFSSLNVLPKDINVESSDPTNGGYHREQGGYIYYIHPAWQSSWGGNLKFKDCSVDKIEPKPNRFVWVNPNVWHGIEVVNNTASTNRITVVAWPAGTVEYSSADLIINTL
tara:strand:+ start:233 stop:763 length:531 start_codon:yes stop_codon:yes gene_type:complete